MVGHADPAKDLAVAGRALTGKPIGASAASDFDFYDHTNGGLQPVDSYARLSARAGYRAEHAVTLALSGQNLLIERQKQTRGLEAERRALLSISKAW